MGNRRYVSYTGDNQTGALQRPYGCLTARSRSPDQHIHLSQSLVHPSAGGLLRCTLGGKSCSLSGSFETHGTAAGRRNNAALRVGDTNQGVVEGGIDIGSALYNCSALSTPCSWSRHKFPSPTFYHRFGGHDRQQSGGVPSGFEHWFGSADRGPADRAGAEDHGRNQSLSTGGYSGLLPAAGHLRTDSHSESHESGRLELRTIRSSEAESQYRCLL